jgi:carbonic anhydrase
MKTFNFSLLIVGLAFVNFSCNQGPEESQDTSEQMSQLQQSQPLVEKVLTAEEQAELTPEDVINLLKEGNERFMNNDLTMRDHSEQVRQSTYAQYPKAIVLSCVDSRVPVEDVFDRGIGDVFVARVAGNFVNVDILGSMEFACKVSGSKLILVLGHEHCGAVKATIDDVKLGNITSMLEKIKPAVEISSDYQGEKVSTNSEFVHLVCENNVRNTINEIRRQSPILAEMEESGEIQILGGIYDMDNGKVIFLDQQGTALRD